MYSKMSDHDSHRYPLRSHGSMEPDKRPDTPMQNLLSLPPPSSAVKKMVPDSTPSIAIGWNGIVVPPYQNPVIQTNPQNQLYFQAVTKETASNGNNHSNSATKNQTLTTREHHFHRKTMETEYILGQPQSEEQNYSSDDDDKVEKKEGGDSPGSQKGSHVPSKNLSAKPAASSILFSSFKLFYWVLKTIFLILAIVLALILLIGFFIHHQDQNSSSLSSSSRKPFLMEEKLSIYFETLYTALEWVCEGLELFFKFLKEYFSKLALVAKKRLSTNQNSDSSLSTIGSSTTKPQPQIDWSEGREWVKNFLVGMKNKYSRQSQNTWFQIYSALTSTMTEEEPTMPASIIFLTPPFASEATKSFAVCLAREISKNVHTAFAISKKQKDKKFFLEMSSQSMKGMQSIDAIHQQLDNYFDRDGGKVVIVQNVDEINVEEHLFVFHAYCDNSVAPEKRATFIFTLSVPPKAAAGADEILKKQGTPNRKAMEVTELILDAAWSSLSPDKRPAVISRVAATVVMIEEGDDCSLVDDEE